MPCGWKDNRRSVAHAVRHRLKWFIHLRAHGLNRDMSIQPTLLTGYRTLYNFIYGTIPGISLLIPRHHRVWTVQLMFTLGLRRLPCASLRRNSSFVGMKQTPRSRRSTGRRVIYRNIHACVFTTLLGQLSLASLRGRLIEYQLPLG